MIDNLYLWVKAFHIIAVISWMAGLLYMPRLFVYHSATTKDSDSDQMLQMMERKLMRIIISQGLCARRTSEIGKIFPYIQRGANLADGGDCVDGGS